MSAVAVYLRTETPATMAARHSSSAALANLVVGAGAGRYEELPLYAVNGTAVTRRVLWLLTDETWTQVKSRVRPRDGQRPSLLLPEAPYYNLETSYPRLGQETDALERRRKLWTEATKF
jgi:hypothetical protein